jgi:hypothetical protein
MKKNSNVKRVDFVSPLPPPSYFYNNYWYVLSRNVNICRDISFDKPSDAVSETVKNTS